MNLLHKTESDDTYKEYFELFGIVERKVSGEMSE